MTDMTAEQIAALAAQGESSTTAFAGATTVQDPQVINPTPDANEAAAQQMADQAKAEDVAPAGDLTLEDMQIAMLSATEVTFKNGRSLPIVKFTDANGNQVTSLVDATCAHAGDGSISIPLVGVSIAR